jgi:hypothetical protein
MPSDVDGDVVGASPPGRFRQSLRRPRRRQSWLMFLSLVFALMMGVMQYSTRKSRDRQRLSVWGWSSKARSRSSAHELDSAIVNSNGSMCEWDCGTDDCEQVGPSRWCPVQSGEPVAHVCQHSATTSPVQHSAWNYFAVGPSHSAESPAGCANLGQKSGTYARRRRYTRQRPLDVNRWTCHHVAQWLGEQRWHWKELAAYQQQICVVGVDGATLYFVDEYDLEQDLQV